MIQALKRTFCTVMIAVALSAAEISGTRKIRHPEPIVLSEPPSIHYPPRSIAWKPRHRSAELASL